MRRTLTDEEAALRSARRSAAAKARHARSTPEERRAAALRAVNARWARQRERRSGEGGAALGRAVLALSAAMRPEERGQRLAGLLRNPACETPTGALRALTEVAADGVCLSLDDIASVADAPAAPAVLRATARQLLLAATDPRRFKPDESGTLRMVGHDPEPGRAWDRLADRLEGKARASLTVTTRTERTPEELRASLRALLAQNPALGTILGEHFASDAPMLPSGEAAQ